MTDSSLTSLFQSGAFSRQQVETLLKLGERVAEREGGGGGGISWLTVDVDTPMVPNTAYIVDASAGIREMTLPDTTAPGQQFIAHAFGGSVRILTAGNDITDVGIGNDLLVAPSETAHLVARTAGNLEIV